MADLQKEIAKLLSKEAKTEDQLLEELHVSVDLLTKTLKVMLNLKLIKKEGYPARYSLSDKIVEKLLNRKELSDTDKNKIRASILIESKADDKGQLRKAMENILSKLKKDDHYLVYESSLAEILLDEDENLFSTYISAEVSCPTLEDLFRLIYFYGVTSIDIIKPDKLQVPLYDLQQSLQTIVDMTHGYAQMIFQLRGKVEQLEQLLNKK
jgi:hypothetical protein